MDLLDGASLDTMMRGAPVAGGTLDAFRRRLHAAGERMGHLVSGHSQARNRTIDWSAQQVTVVDIHSLHSTAQLFVVGVLLKRMMEQKEQQGGSRPLVFVVLDELNKYAPREGWSPLHSVLLDIAERGRSLGVSLFGAQQTASEVERRIVGNAVAEGGGTAGCGGGRAQRVRLPHARRSRAGHAAAAGLDDRGPAGDSRWPSCCASRSRRGPRGKTKWPPRLAAPIPSPG